MFRRGPRTSAALALLMVPGIAFPAAFTTKIQPGTILGWDRYIQRFEQSDAADRPLLAGTDPPVLSDVNPEGRGAGGEDLPNGYIHHWRGVMRLPGVSAPRIESVIGDYAHWKEIYAPDVRFAEASPRQVAAGRGYDLRMVTEQVDGLLHFAFDAHFHVLFRRVGEWAVVDSRSYQIRESNSGHAPYTDLLPEGNDHGILWRLNTYWRIRDLDGAAYAECQVISLSRKPLFGTQAHIKARARESLESTMRHTRDRAMARP